MGDLNVDVKSLKSTKKSTKENGDEKSTKSLRNEANNGKNENNVEVDNFEDSSDEEEPWSYDNRNQWKAGHLQSPIDLVLRNSVPSDFPHLQLERFDKNFIFQLMNTGNTVRLKINNKMDKSPRPVASGGKLNGEYVFSHIDFHWKAEHTIEGQREPLEVQIVTYNNNYSNFKEATTKDNGLALFSVLCKHSCSTSDTFRLIKQTVENLTKIHQYGPKTMTRLLIVKDFLPSDTTKYYRYAGSTTTPPCSENVTWTVFTEPLNIDPELITAFQNFKTRDGKLLDTTSRATQKLNKRIVMRSFHCPCGTKE